MAKKAKYTLISADSHVLEPADLFAKRLPSHLVDRAPKLQPHDGGSAWFIGEDFDPVPLPPSARTGSGYRLSNLSNAGAVAYEDVLPALVDPVERIKAQEADSVDAEVLYPSSALWDAIKLLDDNELKLALVQAYNDWIAEFVAHAPDRLIGLGKVPTTSVEDAVAEVHRCAGLKLRGLVLDCFPSGAKVGGNPADDPFWEAVNETGLVVSLHIAVGPTANTTPESGPAPGMRPQMAEAVLPMVASGVFDRYENVRIVLAHGDAGWSMHWLEFTDMYYLRHKHLNAYTLKNEDALPSEYIRSRVWFTFHHDQTAVKNRHNIGPAHLMWASHFPYDDSNWPDNRQQASRITAEAPENVRQGFLANNVARLYGLPGYEAGFDEAEIKEFVPLVHY